MKDREMLELAAKAAGLHVEWVPEHECVWIALGQGLECRPWLPLTDDGDALRLAVKLRIDILFDGHDSPNAHVETVANLPNVDAQPWAHEAMKPDNCAATRLAITRAAAEIGKRMEGKNA